MNHSNALAGFKPIQASDLTIFSEKTRREMVWDLATAGDIDRVEGSLGSTPLLRTVSGSSVLDLDLCALLLWKADEARFPIFLDAIEHAALAAQPTNLTGFRHSSDKDFGSLASMWALGALEAFEQSDVQGGQQALGRVVALCSKLKLPIEQHNSDAFSFYASKSNFLYGFLEVAPGIAARADKILQRLTLASNSLLAWAVALGVQGSMDLLGALCERPAWRTGLVEALSGLNPSTFKEFAVLKYHAGWHAEPVFMQTLLRMAEGATSTPLPLSSEIATAMVEGARSDWNAPSIHMLRERVGDECLALSLRNTFYMSNSYASKARSLVMCFAIDPQSHPALGLWMSEYFKPVLQSSRDFNASVFSVLRESLFSSLPGISELTQASWKLARGAESDPWSDCYLGANAERYLEAICKCGRPDSVGPALSGYGLTALQAFPNARKGLDASATMWILDKAPLAIFEATLDWFDAQGALSAQAGATAWVCQSFSTRKKGDLLSACVAHGKLDAAEALLARAPHLDTRFAREVAKTMGTKEQNDKGGSAVSTWEALLLRRTLQENQTPEPSGPTLTPRRVRL